MPKFFISVDEEYPFYELSREGPEWRAEYFIDLTEEEFRDFESMMSDYSRWNKRISERYDEILDTK